MTIRQRAGMALWLFAVCVAGACMVNPVAQPLGYHQFADQNPHLGIPHFWNVISNLPFLWVGWVGWQLTVKSASDPERFLTRKESHPYLVAFFGIALVALGSAWYHLDPNNRSLFWDRLPITVGFMGVLSALIAERIDVGWGLKLLPVFVLTGIASVVYWSWTESMGQGDLRPYALVQFFPMVLLPMMLIGYPARYDGVRYLFGLFAGYGIAKALEATDGWVFDMTGGMMSGHALKHLVASAACYSLVLYIKHRTPHRSGY